MYLKLFMIVIRDRIHHHLSFRHHVIHLKLLLGHLLDDQVLGGVVPGGKAESSPKTA